MIEDFYYKSKSLREEKTPKSRKVFEIVRKFLEKEYGAKFSTALISSLFLDISFMLNRYEPWVESRLFWYLIEDYLSSYYEFSSKFAGNFTESLMKYCGIVVDVGDLEGEKCQELVMYFFVKCVSPHDPVSRDLEIGIGKSLVKIIKNYFDKSSEDSTPSHIPRLEAVLNEIMRRVGKDRLKTPWIIDIYETNFLLQRKLSGRTWKIDDTRFFNLAGEIGMVEAFVKARKGRLSNIGEDNVLLECLERGGLVYRCPETNHPRLTENGLCLTANYIAARFYEQEDSKLGLLAKMPSPYQAAILSSLPDVRLMELFDLMQKDLRRLGIEATRICIGRLHSKLDDADIVHFLKNKYDHLSCRQKQLIDSWLDRISSKKMIRHPLKSVAISNPLDEILA